jgi:hypothetical protein
MERWYKLDEHGDAKIELVASPTVVVIIYKGKLCTRQLAKSDTRAKIRFMPDSN